MAKDNGDKTPSADEIIEALAIDLGVDGEDAKKKGAAAGGTAENAVDTVEEPTDVKPVAAVPKAKAARAKPPKPPLPKKPAPTTKKKRASSAPKPAVERSGEHHREHFATQEEVVEVIDQEHGLDALFNISGEGGDPYVEEYYDPDLDGDEVRIGGGFVSTLMKMGLALLVTGALLGGTFAAIPDEYRQDIGPLLSCEDVQSQRRLRRQIQAEEERRQWLAEQPKYGMLTVLTRPGFSRVIIEGQPTFTEHPSRESTLVETRSGTTFVNLDIRDHYVLSITLPNYQDRRVDLFPYDQDNSLWQQRVDDGAWFLEMNELLAPAMETAEELRLRMTSAAAPDLIGEIAVRTNPPGAQIYYNNRLLVGEDGLPLTTPITFTSYPPPPPEPPVEGQEPPPEVPREPIPVTLRATGVPIRVELEGYMPVTTGVYRHMFTCNLNEGVAAEAPFWERCGYTYDTGVLELLTPEQFAPAEEGSGEGTGQGAAGPD